MGYLHIKKQHYIAPKYTAGPNSNGKVKKKKDFLICKIERLYNTTWHRTLAPRDLHQPFD